MQLVLHAGAHNTDEDRLVKCLTANKEMLAERGTEVPHPTQYRRPLRDILHAALQGTTPADQGEAAMDALGLDKAPERLILSNPGFYGTPRMAASGGEFYTSAVPRTQTFQEIFEGAEIELFFAICNPAIFLPSILPQTKFDSLPAYLNGTPPSEMRWSEMIRRVRDALPDIEITVWCNEDTPLIWGQLLRRMADIEPDVPLIGEHAFLHEILTPDGSTRFEEYLTQHPDMSEMQKQHVIATFLDKYADQNAVEEELDLPGWSDRLVSDLSDLFDADVEQIARIPGITLITP